MMVKRAVFCLSAWLVLATSAVWAGIVNYDYVEADDGIRATAGEWKELKPVLHASWASRNELYVKTAVPQLTITTDTVVYAWRGERVGVEAVLFSPVATPVLSLRLSEWTNGEARIARENGTARFLRYVLTDEFRSCGTHPTTLHPYLVPDVIDVENSLALEGRTTRPVWVTLEVPREAAAGTYSLTLDVLQEVKESRHSGVNAAKRGKKIKGVKEGKEVVAQLTLRVVVLDRTLPAPEDQHFHLDFWQQPYSVSRYYGVERWSDEHLKLLRPYMELLARAGQSVVTTILFYEPWGDQSHDKFSPMIHTTKRRDGTWTYNYDIFDRWVDFMASCGISKQINCYSMVPWDMSFRYFDEALGRDVDLSTKTSSDEYRELWTAFLTSFAAHLKAKGWFEKTLIAMDERGLSSMLDAYSVVRQAVPDMKMALAGSYHGELVDKLADYSVAFGHSFPAEELRARRSKGWPTTVYTCCTEARPNLFTNSLPAEAAFLPVYAVANDFDGYLHWSWMNWADDPLRDSRFRLFSPGDTYCIYPGPRSSVRWERFIEGVEQAEKIRILREECNRKGDTAALTKLEVAVSAFRSEAVTSSVDASRAVDFLESVLNQGS